MRQTEGMVLAVVERPFFAEVIAAFEHFAVGGGGFGRGRLKTETSCVRTAHTLISGLKVLCRLRLTLIIRLESFY